MDPFGIFTEQPTGSTRGKRRKWSLNIRQILKECKVNLIPEGDLNSKSKEADAPTVLPKDHCNERTKRLFVRVKTNEKRRERGGETKEEAINTVFSDVTMVNNNETWLNRYNGREK